MKRAGSQDHDGVVTVAWLSPSPGILHLGFSFCNPGQKGVPPGPYYAKGSKKQPEPDFEGRPSIPPDAFCKSEGRDRAMQNLYDDPLVFTYLYSTKRAVCDMVRAALTHDRRLKEFASIPATLKVPGWTKGLSDRPKKIFVTIGRGK